MYFSMGKKLNHFRGTEPTGSTLRDKLYKLQNGGSCSFHIRYFNFWAELKKLQSVIGLLIHLDTAFNMHTVKKLIFGLDFLKYTQDITNFSVVLTKYSDESSSSHSSGAQRKVKKFYISRIITYTSIYIQVLL
jgi:hypothetical protein